MDKITNVLRIKMFLCDTSEISETGNVMSLVDVKEAAIPIGNHNDSEPLNISDVFDAITLADPTFGAGAVAEPMAHHEQPSVQIIEQPASKALRFRYECEGRSAGSIPGVNTTAENKTYPTIRITGYKGPVVIVVSCVTRDAPYRPHPHNLVGRERCERGVCTVPMHISDESRDYQFKNLGIQCVKRRDIAEALRVREQLRVDPFRTGFNHKNHPQSIDLNAVRLCFQVFLPDESGRMRRPLPPAVSEIIYDKKAMSELLIVRASHCSGTVRGGTQVIILCEKVTREDTVVVFYEKDNDQVVWEEPAITILVHKTCAIAFETPPYRNPNTTEHVNVLFELKRVTDNARSTPMPFEYIPDFPGKRRKMVNTLLQAYEHERIFQPDQKPIKSEPRDKASPHHVSSPPLHVYAPQYGEQNWGIDNMQGGMAMPGPSHNNPFAQDMWQPQYGHAPTLHPAGLQPMASGLHAQAMSPTLQPLSPVMQAMSPGMQAVSPVMQAVSPGMQVMSPSAASMSPGLQAMSPGGQMHGMGHVSPSMAQAGYGQQMALPMQMQAQGQGQGQPQPQPMEGEHSSPSLSTLLLEQADGLMLNSGELSSLSSMLGRANADLGDALIL